MQLSCICQGVTPAEKPHENANHNLWCQPPLLSGRVSPHADANPSENIVLNWAGIDDLRCVAANRNPFFQIDHPTYSEMSVPGAVLLGSGLIGLVGLRQKFGAWPIDEINNDEGAAPH